MTTLTMKDEKRLDVIQRVYRSELTVGQAALVMGLSERQCYRVKARVGKVGAKGVVHGNRGRPCKRRLKDSTVRRVLELARGKYQGFNDHHLRKQKERLQFDTKLRHSIVSPVNNCGKLVIRPFSDIYLTRFITAMCPCFVRGPRPNKPQELPCKAALGAWFCWAL